MQIRPLNKNNPEPLYRQLYSILADMIYSGEIKAGERIPPERELADSLSVSRITARQAIDALVESGMVYREQGRGTFVAEPKMRGVIGFASFSEEMIARGLNPSSIVLKQEVIRVNDRLQNALKLGPEEHALHLVRLRLVDGKPVAYQASYLPHRLCPGLETEPIGSQSLYSILRERYYINPTWTEAEVEAKHASAEEAHELQIEKNDPVLVINGITFTESFEVIESVRTVYRSKGLAIYLGRQRISSLVR
jgi:GntR family transcriptional regulator